MNLSPVDDLTTAPAEPTYYLSKDNEVFGPHSVAELQGFLDASVILPAHHVWQPGMEEWLTIEQAFFPAAEGIGAGIPEAAPDPEASTPPETVPLVSPADDWEVDPEAQVARIRNDRSSRRFSVATITAIFFHLGLLVTVAWAAPDFLKVAFEPPKVETKEPPPLEVAFIPEPPDEPPPVAPPPEMPPPDLPPPPTAMPDIPLDTPPPAPPAPMPDPAPVPQPVLDTPNLPPMTLPVAHRKPPPRPVLARAPEISDASSTDYLDAPPPHYPPEAEREREEGTVILLVAVDESGHPVGVRVQQSSGFALLDQTALHQVVDNYRFTPGSARLLRVPIAFRMAR